MSNYITSKEIAELTGISLITFKRRIKELKSNHFSLYKEISKRDGRNVIYLKEKILPFIQNFQSNKEKGKHHPPKHKKIEKKKILERGNTLKPKRKLQGEITEIKKVVTQEEIEFLEMPLQVKEVYDKIEGDNEKERFQLVFRAMHFYSQKSITLDEACSGYGGFSERSLFYWIDRHKSINMLKKYYEVQRNAISSDRVRQKAQNSIEYLVEGDRYEETTTQFKQLFNIDGSVINVPTSKRVSEKRVLPNLGAVIFALTNRLPDEWKNIQRIEAENVGKKSGNGLEDKSNEELLLLIKNAIDGGYLSVENTDLSLPEKD